MAKKTIDFTKSATDAAQDINDNFTELYDNGAQHAESGGYGDNIILGGDVEYPTSPVHLVEDLNTIRMIKDMRDSRINVSGEYGHEPQMLIHNGKAYIAYMYHEQGNGEGWQSNVVAEKPKVRFSIVNLSTMAIESSLMVAQYGDTVMVDGEEYTINTAGSPNVVMLNNDTIRIVFGPSILFYRDYTISTGQFGTITPCTLTKDGTTVTASIANMGQLMGETGDCIQPHSQYALINGTYYISIGNGTTNRNGQIFTTTDFANFTWFAKPSIPAIGQTLGYNSELAVFPWINSATGECCLYLAMRRGNGVKNIIAARMYIGYTWSQNNGFSPMTHQVINGVTYHGPGEIDLYQVLPARASRPCFFAPCPADFAETRKQRNIFLTFDNVAQEFAHRQYTDVCYFKVNEMNEGATRRISQCLTMTYPSIVYHEGYYYVAYQGYTTGNQPHVLLSKFRPYSANWDKVISALAKMFDTFEPEEE